MSNINTAYILDVLNRLHADSVSLDREYVRLVTECDGLKARLDIECENSIAVQKKNLENEKVRKESNKRLHDDAYAAGKDKLYQTAQEQAVRMASIIEALNSKQEELKEIDKYFKKYFAQFGSSIERKIQNKYSEVSDILGEADTVYREYEKYFNNSSKYLLPMIINGLNYHFSSKRKNLYQRLIELYYRAVCLKEQLGKRESLNRSIKALQEDTERKKKMEDEQYSESVAKYHKNVEALNKKKENEKSNADNKLAEDISSLKKKALLKIQGVIPQEDYLESAGIIAAYLKHYGKLNSTYEQLSDLLFMGIAEYDYTSGFSWEFLKKAVHDRFKKTAAKNCIRFPFTSKRNEKAHFFVDAESMDSEKANQFIHSMMFSALSFAPLGEIEFNIMDKLRFGNNVKPFFTTKESLPELFHDQFFTERSEIEKRIHEINTEMQDDIVAKNFNRRPLFLILFDFPDVYSEDTMLKLKNILENGHLCDVHVIIHGKLPKEDTYQKESVKMARDVLALCRHIHGNQFQCEDYPIIVQPFPTEKGLSDFQSSYAVKFYANLSEKKL